MILLLTKEERQLVAGWVYAYPLHFGHNWHSQKVNATLEELTAADEAGAHPAVKLAIKKTNGALTAAAIKYAYAMICADYMHLSPRATWGFDVDLNNRPSYVSEVFCNSI